MSEERKENAEEKSIKMDSPEFKAGYRQGYLDGMVAMGEKVRDKLKDLNAYVKTSTNDGK